MSLPTPTDLVKMDYTFQGQPFVDIPAKSTITLTTMDYTFQGQPFVSNPSIVSGPSNLKSYNTNLKANIKSISGNLIANVKSLNTNV